MAIYDDKDKNGIPDRTMRNVFLMSLFLVGIMTVMPMAILYWWIVYPEPGPVILGTRVAVTLVFTYLYARFVVSAIEKATE